MTRGWYFGLLIGGAVALGLASLMVPEEYSEEVMKTGGRLGILVFIPLLAFLRMRYIGMSWKEIVLSFIPFHGIKYRSKKLFYDKKTETK
ncbi:hypothetical protein [Telluribacter sp. SYSU D00476]|uniref:hypothetical protein n=1 Tax=Telluribacter sp. SYSU D00476 TaxID=2811430 RepID=UPI001FF5D2D1|nr:hypothetical protein [Telluribacter sp. SYSU D00476]